MNTLCALQGLIQAMDIFEKNFLEVHGLNLKEGMLLCCIAEQQLTASDIACKIDLTNSNCSKVIKSVEQKGLIERSFGIVDKRKMFFVLTVVGKEKMTEISMKKLDVPEILSKYIEIYNKTNTNHE